MVSSAKILLKTGVPSGGQFSPVNGWQRGDEKGLIPTRLTPFVTVVPLGINRPPAPALYGRCSPPDEVWMIVPGGIRYWTSSLNGAQVPAPRMSFRSRQVWALPKLRSREASK